MIHLLCSYMTNSNRLPRLIIYFMSFNDLYKWWAKFWHFDEDSNMGEKFLILVLTFIFSSFPNSQQIFPSLFTLHPFPQQSDKTVIYCISTKKDHQGKYRTILGNIFPYYRHAVRIIPDWKLRQYKQFSQKLLDKKR